MQIKNYKLILFLTDILVIAISVYISYLLKLHQLEVEMATYFNPKPTILFPFVIVMFSQVIMFRNANLYKIHMLFDSYYQFVVIVKSALISYGILITTLFFFKHSLIEQRSIITANFLILTLFLNLYRIVILKYSMRYALTKKILGERVMLIGAGEKGREIARELINNKYAYFRPVGFMDDQKQGEFEGIKVLGKIEDVDKFADNFDELLIALTNVSYNNLQRIINTCKKVGKPIHVISDLYRVIPEKLEVEKFDGFSTFQIPPVTEVKQYPFLIIKRIIDYVIATLIIVLLLPLWCTIIVLIKVGSKGPVFYKTKVVGYKEKEFVWYKFRSMYHNNDDTVHRDLVREIAEGKRDGEKIQNDSRVTEIGKWLRKYSIDEFPQLINVLKGQMSLVGPRPVLPYEFELLDDWQKERFTALPGMTGLWQVRGRNKVNFEDQHVLDLYYVKNRSLIMDFTILFNTVSVVISGKTGI